MHVLPICIDPSEQWTIDLGEVKLRKVELPGKSPLAEGTLEECMAELHVLVAACQWWFCPVMQLHLTLQSYDQ